MFGYDIVTTVAALVALGAILSVVPLIFARNFVEIVKPAVFGVGAWVLGGLTPTSFVGVATGFIGLILALVNGTLAALGVQLPFSVGAIVLLVAALALLSKRGNKK